MSDASPQKADCDFPKLKEKRAIVEDKVFVVTLCDRRTFWITADDCARIVH